MANQQNQFSDDELEQIKRYGQALGGVTPFDEEVDRWALIHEVNYAKMRAARRVDRRLPLEKGPLKEGKRPDSSPVAFSGALERT